MEKGKRAKDRVLEGRGHTFERGRSNSDSNTLWGGGWGWGMEHQLLLYSRVSQSFLGFVTLQEALSGFSPHFPPIPRTIRMKAPFLAKAMLYLYICCVHISGVSENNGWILQEGSWAPLASDIVLFSGQDSELTLGN